MDNNQASKEFLEISQSVTRGKLKIYIGSIAGVGKTYRMLQEAHYLQSKGVDVVVGYVETHMREETHALLNGLNIIPRTKIKYRDVEIEEMDLERLLELKPNIVIVDELAHSNIPLCKNRKRYQDVLDILNNGSNVICAFNVQHLESLNDVVYQFTATKINETVPDSFIQNADQVVNIDLSVEDIIERLNSGKIYKEHKIEQALQNFFKVENISKLREIALREVAESVDRDYMVNISRAKEDDVAQISGDKLLFLLQPQEYSQKPLIRKAARLAGKINAEWFVVYIEGVNLSTNDMARKRQEIFYDDVGFAEGIGANFIHLRSENYASAVVNYARAHNISHIVLNAQNERHFRTFWGATPMSQILKEEPELDIYLLSMNVNEQEV